MNENTTPFVISSALAKGGGAVDTESVIDRFDGEYRWLSNFSRHRTHFAGVTYPTVEHAFQAAKAADPTERDRIRTVDSPTTAKRLGRRITLRADWEDVKTDIMRVLVARKFEGPLQASLLATGDAYLIEGNNWGDRIWGAEPVDGRWVGENRLGTILMELRDRLRVEWETG